MYELPIVFGYYSKSLSSKTFLRGGEFGSATPHRSFIIICIKNLDYYCAFSSRVVVYNNTKVDFDEKRDGQQTSGKERETRALRKKEGLLFGFPDESRDHSESCTLAVHNCIYYKAFYPLLRETTSDVVL